MDPDLTAPLGAVWSGFIVFASMKKSSLKCTWLFAAWGEQWFSGRVLDSRLRGCGFRPHWRHSVVSLDKTLYPLLCTGSTQEVLSQHDWKIVDWDVKSQNKLYAADLKTDKILRTKNSSRIRLKHLFCHNRLVNSGWLIFHAFVVVRWHFQN